MNYSACAEDGLTAWSLLGHGKGTMEERGKQEENDVVEKECDLSKASVM